MPSPSPPPSRPRTPRCRGRASAGIPVLRRAEILAAIAATRRTSRWPAPTARRRPRRCSRSCWSRPACDPSFIVGGDSTRSAAARCGPTASGSWSRPTRATARSSSSAPRSRSSPTSSPTTSTTTATSPAIEAAFDGSSPTAPGPNLVCADDPAAARLGAGPAARLTYGTARRADYRIVDPVDAAGHGSSFRLRAPTASDARRGRAARCPGSTTPATPPRRSPPALELGAPFEAGGPRWPASAAWPAASSSGARRGVTVRRRLRPPPRQGPRRARRRRGRRLAPGRRRVPAAPLHPHRRTCGRDFADAFVDADVVVRHRHLRGRRAPRPGRHRQARRRRGARRPPVGRGSPGCPRRDDLVPYLASELRPGDLCLTLGRRRRHLAARRAAAGPCSSARPGDRRSARRRWPWPPTGSGDRARRRRAARPADDLPGRRPGRAVRDGGGRRRPGRAGRGGAASRGCRPSWSGRARTCWSPTPASRARLRASASAFAGIDVERHDVVTGRRRRAPARWWPAARRAAGLTGFEWAVGVPGSIGGAVRMNAGGHGSDMAATLVRVRVVDLRGGEDGVVPAAGSTSRYRRSSVAARARWSCGPSSALGRGRPRRGEAELGEIVRWRRANQPGGQNAGSVFTNPPGDSAGRLDRRGRVQGPAGRHRRGVDQARQLHPGRRGRLGRRRAGADGARCASPGAEPRPASTSCPRPGSSGSSRDRPPSPGRGRDREPVHPRIRARRIEVRRDEGRRDAGCASRSSSPCSRSWRRGRGGRDASPGARRRPRRGRRRGAHHAGRRGRGRPPASAGAPMIDVDPARSPAGSSPLPWVARAPSVSGAGPRRSGRGHRAHAGGPGRAPVGLGSCSTAPGGSRARRRWRPSPTWSRLVPVGRPRCAGRRRSARRTRSMLAAPRRRPTSPPEVAAISGGADGARRSCWRTGGIGPTSVGATELDAKLVAAGHAVLTRSIPTHRSRTIDVRVPSSRRS